MRRNRLRLSLDGRKQKRCETQEHTNKEVKPSPRPGQLWSSWGGYKDGVYYSRGGDGWWGTCFGPSEKQEISLEGIKSWSASLILPRVYFSGAPSSEGARVAWDILVNAFCISESRRRGCCWVQWKLGTPRCKENSGNGDKIEHFRREEIVYYFPYHHGSILYFFVWLISIYIHKE